MNILLGYILTYTYILLILLVTSLLHTKFHVKEEITRKLVHIFVGFSWFIMVYFFKTSIHLIIPPLTFIFINYFSYQKNLLKSMEKKEKNSLGTIYYALSFTILACLTYFYHSFLPFYGLGVLTMAIADGLAPFIGSKSLIKIGSTSKTYLGTIFIFLSTIIIAFSFNYAYSLGFTIPKYLIFGLSASILELIGSNGTDNLTLPLGLAMIASIL